MGKQFAVVESRVASSRKLRQRDVQRRLVYLRILTSGEAPPSHVFGIRVLPAPDLHIHWHWR